MSAFVVTDRHINAIVTAANCSRTTSTMLGRMLLAENIASVAHRYRLKYGSEEARGYRDQLAAYAFEPVDVDAAQLAKAIACLDYQSCEHPGWATSKAKQWLDRVAEPFADCHKTEAYEHAAWGL